MWHGAARSRRKCRRDCKLQHNFSNHGEPSGQMDGKCQEIAGSSEPPDLVYRRIAHNGDNHILFGNGGGAGVARQGMKIGKGGLFHAVCRFSCVGFAGIKSLAIMARQFCAANGRS
jgi:hypothetical protein